MPTRGIDISHWQTVNDWDALQNHLGDNGFIIIKAGGNENGKAYTDRKAREFVGECQKRNIKYGLYFYCGGQIDRAEAGREAAKAFCHIIDGLRAYQAPMGFWCDYEEGKLNAAVGNTNAVINFCNQVARFVLEWFQKQGIVPEFQPFCGIYGSDISTFKNMLQAGRLTGYYKWVARYGKKPPVYINDWTIWQHSSTGVTPGVLGYCDQNVIHDFE